MKMTSDTNENTAINFRKLMMEEKRRLKEERRKKKMSSVPGTVENGNVAKLGNRNACSASTHSNTNVNSNVNSNAFFNQNIENNGTIPIPKGRANNNGVAVHDQDVEWVHIHNMLKDSPMLDLERHSVSDDLQSVYYMSHFLTSQHEQRLTQWLCALPSEYWTSIRYGKRRVALFDGQLPLPLEHICKSLISKGVFDDDRYPPNHVLVNEYSATQGIMPHTDGPLYYHKTATISIGGGDVLLKFTPRLTSDQIESTPYNATLTSSHNNNKQTKEVWLEGHGSLVVFKDDAYINYCHGIDDRISMERASEECTNAKPGQAIRREYRISLTFRHKYKQNEVNGVVEH